MSVGACCVVIPGLSTFLLIDIGHHTSSTVQGYIYRLDNFDGPAVAEKAIEHGLAEEAFEIYKKFNKRVEAIKVRSYC